jgi:hypothetical protein
MWYILELVYIFLRPETLHEVEFKGNEQINLAGVNFEVF